MHPAIVRYRLDGESRPCQIGQRERLEPRAQEVLKLGPRDRPVVIVVVA